MTRNEFRFFIAKLIGYPAVILSILILISGGVKIERDFPTLLCGASLGLLIAVSQELLRKLE